LRERVNQPTARAIRYALRTRRTAAYVRQAFLLGGYRFDARALPKLVGMEIDQAG
jgi:hypothetical protein